MIREFILFAALVLFCFFSEATLAADISVPHTFSAGTPAKADEVNTNFAIVYNAVNGLNIKLTDNITNSNISPNAQIEQSKIQGAPFAEQNHNHKHIIWSGGCKEANSAQYWNTYCADGVDFNTASQYLSANDNGTFTVLVPGFYRINAFSFSSTGFGGGETGIKFIVNGSDIQSSFHSYNAGDQSFNHYMDVTWLLNANDTLSIQYYASFAGDYTYSSWSDKKSRLQVTYLGEQ